MDIQDYIEGLPVAVDGPTGRLGNHAVVHAGLQDHEERLATMESLPLRLDTTVGTRIFAGDTMIYGDTGRRKIQSSDPSVFFHMRRIGDLVSFEIATTSFLGLGTINVASLPLGFMPSYIQRLQYSENSGMASSKLMVVFSSTGLVQTRSKAEDGGLYFHAQWVTSDPWPTTLPGLPA